MSPRRVSVVVPTKNGMATLPAVLDALDKQREGFALEIVAVDSGSDDGTRALLASRVDRLIEIRAEAFDHGTARNTGIEGARGELVVLLVQDAVPASDTWLSALVAPLLADPTVAGTFARQTPRPDASALARLMLSRWVAASREGRVVALTTPAALEAMTPMERLLFCAFDNVCSCIRRTVWHEHPFRRTPIAEDLQWAREVLLAGYRLAYVPEAVVVHSHDRSAWHEFARTRALHRRLFELFELQTIPGLPALARAIATSMVLHLRCESAHPENIPRAVALAVAWPLGQYAGARAAARPRQSGSHDAR